MKILFTGASSFTGMWFVEELAKAGHEITAAFPRAYKDYQGIRKERVDRAIKICHPVFSALFGSSEFLKVIDSARWDQLCHHGADVTDYRSPDFDFARALSRNTHNIEQVLIKLKHAGCHRVILTGSIFEPHEGKGDENLRAFSPYGLSKGLTSEVFRYFCEINKISLTRFIIPNPFGPYEEPRYTDFLAKSWFAKETPVVKFPEYIRDNIHVSLLAKIYAKCVICREFGGSKEWKGEKIGESLESKVNPTGYAESQGDFTKRFSHELSNRLNMPCDFIIATQTDFSEPMVRVNTDIPNVDWNEVKAWDDLAVYYQMKYGLK